MGLKKFDRSCSRTRSTGAPSVRVTKHGCIYLNKTAVENLKLGIDSKITILQDSKNPKDWYIEVTNDEHGFVLRKTTGKGLCFSSSVVAKEILKVAAPDGVNSVSILLAGWPEDGMWAMITNSVR